MAEKSLAFLKTLFGGHDFGEFGVRLWDGTIWSSGSGRENRFTLVFKSPAALRRMFWFPNEVKLGEAYIYDDFDIEGDCEGVFELGEHILAARRKPGEMIRLGKFLLSLPRGGGDREGRQKAALTGIRHSRQRDRQAIAYHYDVSNDFYKLWLDDNMVYSCAYFSSPDDNLNAAQERKLDYICMKLRLAKEDRLLDIGCGWGGLVMHAARNYDVIAEGITLSRPQAEFARERIEGAGLSDRCRVEMADYREVDEGQKYDKLVSVGMFEHVGHSKLPEYFQKAYRLLKPGGVFLNHGIARSEGQDDQRGPTFSDAYVFPDGELLQISTTLGIAEKCGFEVRDLESLREHYMMTLRRWVRRLEERRDEALRHVDEPTYRVWRLFMSGSAHGFRAGRLNVYQALLLKPDKDVSGLPLVRDDWYK
jgi:cyclopropane-fatty-acyl-phospholipid synthase